MAATRPSSRRPDRPQQRCLALRGRPTRGGARPGAGRKRTGNTRVPHRTRPTHRAYHPAHTTLRAVRLGFSLRRRRLFYALRSALSRSHKEPGFRVVHFSVQSNHAHFIVEAQDKVALARGMQGLAIRFAQTVNRLYSRRGSVWSERYHARALRSPREVRNALVYVLANVAQYRARPPGTADVCSSAPWFDGFSRPPIIGPDGRAPRPVASPTTWLARIGWRRLGLIDPDEVPRAARPV